MNNRVLNITLNEDKSLTFIGGKSLKLGNQFDNKITKIVLTIPEMYQDIKYKYCVVKNPYDYNILKTLDDGNSFLIENDISKFSGNLNIMYVFSNTEVLSNLDLNNNDVVLTTDTINCVIVNNYIEEAAQVGLFCIPNSVFETLDETTKNLLNTYKVI